MNPNRPMLSQAAAHPPLGTTIGRLGPTAFTLIELLVVWYNGDTYQLKKTAKSRP